METTTSDLLKENALVLVLLPSLADGLFTLQSKQQYLAKATEELIQQSQSDEQRLKWQQVHAIVKEKGSENETVHVIDKDKAIMLAYTFGAMFMSAMAIVDGRGIVVEVAETENKQRTLGLSKYNVLLRYFGGDFSVPVVISVALVRADAKPAPDEEGLHILEERSILEQVRRYIEKDQTHFKYLFEPSLPVRNENRWKGANLELVDLKIWYCSCSEYQRQILGCSRRHPEPSLGEIPLKRLCSSQETISKVSNGDYLLHKLMRHPTNTYKMPQPVPVCSHLLAVYIMAANFDEGFLWVAT